LRSPDRNFPERVAASHETCERAAALEWRHELRCSDDGVGDAAGVDRRLGVLGVLPDAGGQRCLLWRGLCDVWLAQRGGRIEARLLRLWVSSRGCGQRSRIVLARCGCSCGREPDAIGADGGGAYDPFVMDKGKPRVWTEEEARREEEAQRARVRRDAARGVSTNLREAVEHTEFARRFAAAFEHRRRT
jgi:hypothetical protein